MENSQNPLGFTWRFYLVKYDMFNLHFLQQAKKEKNRCIYFVSVQNPPKQSFRRCSSSSSSRKQEEKLLILDAAPDRARSPKQSLAATRKRVLFRPAAPPGSLMHNGWASSETRCPPTRSAVSRGGREFSSEVEVEWNSKSDGASRCLWGKKKKKKSVEWTCEIVPVSGPALASASVFSCCCCYCCCISSANPKSCHQRQPLHLMAFISCSVSCFANKTTSTCRIWWTRRPMEGVKDALIGCRRWRRELLVVSQWLWIILQTCWLFFFLFPPSPPFLLSPFHFTVVATFPSPGLH